MLVQAFEKQVSKAPENRAIKIGKKEISYKELKGYTDKIAHLINSLMPGESNSRRVGLLLENGIDMIAAIFGTLKSGNVYVPLSPGYPDERLRYIINHSEASIVITDSACEERIERMASKNRVKILNLEKVDDSAVTAETVKREINGEKLAYIMYTSGSTGKPKGVMQNHQNVIHFIRNWKKHFSISPLDRMTLFSSFCHDASVMDIFGCLLNGAALYPYDVRDRNDLSISEMLREEKITVWHSVPSLFSFFTANLSVKEKFPDLRYIILGGEEVRKYEIEMFKKYFSGVVLVNLYGQTESSINSIWKIRSEENPENIVIGKPIEKTEIFIVDDDGNETDIMETGQILIAGPHISPGYWKNEELSRKIFTENPEFGRLYWTGDTGCRLPNDDILFMGRKDLQVKIRGFRVELGEIETHLLKFSAVQSAAVIAREGKTGNVLTAFIVFKEQVKVTELRKYLTGQLPDYMIPTHFIELEKIPLTQSGKIDRKKLFKIEKEPLKIEVKYEAPETGIENLIANQWKEVIGIDKVGIHENFFDLGGNSFDILHVHNRLERKLERKIPIVKLFKYPNVGALSRYLIREVKNDNVEIDDEEKIFEQGRDIDRRSTDIAVIGMAGRFPGARNIDELWENLKNGRESISFISDPELIESGIDEELLSNSDYIRAKGILEDIEYFDAYFFKYSPREAELMDPQARMFTEVAWEALENAGYDPHVYNGLIGLYAGNVSNHYWLAAIYLNRSDEQGLSVSTSHLSNHFSTLISYNLNLKGPAISMQTACSTSLVAIHMACRSLLEGECHIALSGGISLALPPISGFLYQEGMIFSSDGHCRAFDARAGGTVFGDAACVVVLKRLDDALRDGDYIYAVVKGSAVNNDGSRKIGYTAPSVEGQAEVIENALREAGVENESIGYIEAHGTGTILGDPVEFESLKMVFAKNAKKRSCALGSVKNNVGHLNAAAGAAGFIKTVLCLKNKLIPPCVHFEKRNPEIDFENSPFYVSRELKKWQSDRFPLRAGVSSFGIGGTNAHVILEEVPETAVDKRDNLLVQPQLLLLSAKTQSSLDRMTENLGEYLDRNPHLLLADIAFTLQVGRRDFDFRRTLVCSTLKEAVDILKNPEPEQMATSLIEEKKQVIFMFPGQGSQYVDMGRELYEAEPYFREQMDAIFGILNRFREHDMKEILYPDKGKEGKAPPQNDINQTELAQPLIFSIEYALAKLLMNWGVKPAAMIGHSIGEYTAACLSGVFSLEQGLELVALRGKLMQQMPPGEMVSIPITEEELKPLLTENREISLAAVNAPSSCVISGSRDELGKFLDKLKEKKPCEYRRLSTSHAFHSVLMEPVLKPFTEKLSKISLKNPKIPYISNLTSKWINAGEAADPEYWSKHLRGTIRFADGIKELLTLPDPLFIEIGPGRTLSTLARKNAGKNSNMDVVNTLRHPRENVPDMHFLLNKIGRLWLLKTPVNWHAFYPGEKRRRVPLPTYPFEGQYYWFDGNPFKMDKNNKKNMLTPIKTNDYEDYLYIPSWKRTGKPILNSDFKDNDAAWLIFTDPCGIGKDSLHLLRGLKKGAVAVEMGREFHKENNSKYTLNPENSKDYELLISDLSKNNKIPGKILHLWNVTGDDLETPILQKTEESQHAGFFSLLYLTQAFANLGIDKKMEIGVVTDNLHNINGEAVSPWKATVLGAVSVIPKEFPNIQVVGIDIAVNESDGIEHSRRTEQLIAEMMLRHRERIVAYRGGHRWTRFFEKAQSHIINAKKSRLKSQGVYLITGGLGGIGLTLGRHLAEKYRPRLILTGRSVLPAREKWDKWIREHGDNDPTTQKIQRVRQMEEHGAEVMVVKADAANREEMSAAVKQARERFGKINGVIHSAGVADGAIIQRQDAANVERVLTPKVNGTLILHDLLKNEGIDFFVFCSSMSAITGMFGQISYSAANAFLDAFSEHISSEYKHTAISINWDTWKEVGMAVQAVEDMQNNKNIDIRISDGLSKQQGTALFDRILEWNEPQVAVSKIDIESRIIELDKTNFFKMTEKRKKMKNQSTAVFSRPKLSNPYKEPENDLEKITANVWQDYMGLEQVGTHDNFFDLGANSLDIMHVNTQLRQELKMDIPLIEMYTYPTISSLIRHLNLKEKGEESIEEQKDRTEHLDRGKRTLQNRYNIRRKHEKR